MKNGVILPAMVFAFSLFGQQKFVPGKILECEKKDTLYGEIKINPKKPQDLSRRIVFKSNSGQQKNLKPDKVCVFWLENRKFVSKTLVKDEPEFLEVLVEGTFSFYKGYAEFVNMNETKYEPVFYFSHGTGKPEELDEKKFYKQIRQRIGKEHALLSELEQIKSFEESALISWFQRYNASL